MTIRFKRVSRISNYICSESARGGIGMLPQFVLMFLTIIGTAAGQCANITGSPSPYVAWDIMNWNYTGSLSTPAVSLAMSSWNAAQDETTFSQGGYDDVAITDDTTIPGLAESIRHNDSASACYLHPSASCSWFCNNLSRLYYEEMKLNPTAIQNEANSFSISVDTVTQQAVAHEIGHVFGLTEPNDFVHCYDATIMSADESFLCGFYGPQSCDINAVAFNYQSWTVAQWSVCGSSCDLSSNCSN